MEGRCSTRLRSTPSGCSIASSSVSGLKPSRSRRGLGTTIRPALSILSSMPITMPYAIINGKYLARRVMSSCLCKYGEGAGFPFQVESLEDGVDDAVHAFDVHKAHHRPGAPSYFHEAAFDHIGGP